MASWQKAADGVVRGTGGSTTSSKAKTKANPGLEVPTYDPYSPSVTGWDPSNPGQLNPSIYGTSWSTAFGQFGGKGSEFQTPGKVALSTAKDTTMAALSADQTRNAQMSALAKMQGVMNQGGITAEDQARLNQIRQQQATYEQGQRGALMQGAAQRGMGRSGMNLAQLIAAQSSGANAMAAGGTDVAAQAQARQRQAALDTASMGGGIRGQDYARAQAQDYINQFNTGITNQQNQWNQVGRQQQGFQNFMDLATARANVIQARENRNLQARGQNVGLIGSLGSAALSGR